MRTGPSVREAPRRPGSKAEGMSVVPDVLNEAELRGFGTMPCSMALE